MSAQKSRLQILFLALIAFFLLNPTLSLAGSTSVMTNCSSSSAHSSSASASSAHSSSYASPSPPAVKAPAPKAPAPVSSSSTVVAPKAAPAPAPTSSSTTVPPPATPKVQTVSKSAAGGSVSTLLSIQTGIIAVVGIVAFLVTFH